MRARAHSNGRRAVAALATLTLAGGALAACSKDAPDGTVKAFLTGWKSGDLHAVGFVSAGGGKVADTDVVKQLKDISGGLAKQPLAVTTAGDPKTTGDNATAPIRLDWTLPGGAHWIYQSTVRLTKANTDGWKVVWEPAIVQPQLATGDNLAVRRKSPQRAAILDSKGEPIVTPREVWTIGVEPQKITNLAQLQAGLTSAFAKIGVTLDMSDLKDRVQNAKPDAFVELITLRQADWTKVSGAITALPGTVENQSQKPLAPTRVFARALLGTADEATAEDLQKNTALAQGDVVGHGGLQQKYDAQLRGTPGISVVIAQHAPDGTVKDTPVFTTEPVDGKPVKTSLDVDTQNAADSALASVTQPSSLVAIKVSDGSLLAVANGPNGGTDDTALTGSVPPGSTFKTITAYGVLSNKIAQPSTTVPCPKNVTINGHQFKNSDDEAFGNVQMHVDYAKSCNTAFIGLGGKLGADKFHQAASALGLGGQWDLGVDAFSGKVSPANSPTELAAAAFGQGQTVVSPLAMAGVAAAVARGQFKQPKLVLDPAPAKPAPDGAPLDATAVSQLKSMMREVVTGGTGTGLRNVPGGPVYGKTGTAEFDANANDTHSWFIGFQGDVAFACMIQKGGAGADAAVPAIDRFLTALHK
jgi:cell division protein FtsI/penicillin-binding protein 2